jgi:NADH:ubiquinone oxidoreductase subunit E
MSALDENVKQKGASVAQSCRSRVPSVPLELACGRDCPNFGRRGDVGSDLAIDKTESSILRERVNNSNLLISRLFTGSLRHDRPRARKSHSALLVAHLRAVSLVAHRSRRQEATVDSPARSCDPTHSFSDEQLTRVDEIIAQRKSKLGALIPVLEEVQEVCGYLPMELQTRVARGLGIPVATVYGVVTFYSFFTMVPRGKHVVRVCLGTSCYVRGGQRVLDRTSEVLHLQPGECSKDRNFSLETVRCLGACGLAPVVVVDNETHGQVKAAKIEQLLDTYQENSRG